MTSKNDATTTMRVLPVPTHLMEAAARLNIAGFEHDVGYQVVFPKGDSEEAVQHGAASMRKEAAAQAEKPYPRAWHMMVIDDHRPENIMCFGLWFVVGAPKPGVADPSDTHTPPPDANREAFDLVINESIKARKELMQSLGIGDYLMLASLTTDIEARKQGAATLMLTWGKALATQLGIPCFLQATKAGAPLYKKLGWQAKGILKEDLSKWREGLENTMTLMLWWPEGKEPAET